MNRVDTQELLRLYNATDSGSRVIPCSSAHILDVDGNDILVTEVSVEMTSWDALYSILHANFSGIGNEYCSAPSPVEGESKNGWYDYGPKVLYSISGRKMTASKSISRTSRAKLIAQPLISLSVPTALPPRSAQSYSQTSSAGTLDTSHGEALFLRVKPRRELKPHSSIRAVSTTAKTPR